MRPVTAVTVGEGDLDQPVLVAAPVARQGEGPVDTPGRDLERVGVLAHHVGLVEHPVDLTGGVGDVVEGDPAVLVDGDSQHPALARRGQLHGLDVETQLLQRAGHGRLTRSLMVVSVRALLELMGATPVSCCGEADCGAAAALVLPPIPAVTSPRCPAPARASRRAVLTASARWQAPRCWPSPSWPVSSMPIDAARAVDRRPPGSAPSTPTAISGEGRCQVTPRWPLRWRPAARSRVRGARPPPVRRCTLPPRRARASPTTGRGRQASTRQPGDGPHAVAARRGAAPATLVRCGARGRERRARPCSRQHGRGRRPGAGGRVMSTIQDALQTALAAEHAAIFVYGAPGATPPSRRTDALRHHHRRLPDPPGATRPADALIADRGAEPVAAEAGYDLPGGPVDAGRGRRPGAADRTGLRGDVRLRGRDHERRGPDVGRSRR